MAVEQEPIYIPYQGGGPSSVYPYPYYFRAPSDLIVTTQDSLGNVVSKVLNSDYIVTGILDPELNVYANGGVIEFGVADLTGLTLLISRRTPKVQAAVYQPGDPFPAKSHEVALDALALLIQEIGVHYQGYADGPPTTGIWNVDDWFFIRNAVSYGFMAIICTVGGPPGTFLFKPVMPIGG